MRHQAKLYCSPAVKSKILKETKNISFWQLRFSNPTEADLVLNFSKNTIRVEGIEQTFGLKYDLENILNKISPLDLSYIHELFDTEEERKGMLDLVKSELTKNLDELIAAVVQQNSDSIKNFSHKLNSKLLVLSIPAIEECRFVEQHAAESKSIEFHQNYHLLKLYCLIRLGQIQDL